MLRLQVNKARPYFSNTLYISCLLTGLDDISILQPYAASVISATFIGCVGDLQVDSGVIQLSDTVSQRNVKDTCPRLGSENISGMCAMCGGTAQCHLDWFSASCTCEGFKSHVHCDQGKNSMKTIQKK